METDTESCDKQTKEIEEISEETSGEEEKLVLSSPTDNTGVAEAIEKKPKKSVRFNDFIQVEVVEYYDRTGTMSVVLSPIERFEIRRELNLYKRTEMEVHEQSHGNTRYHSLL